MPDTRGLNKDDRLLSSRAMASAWPSYENASLSGREVAVYKD